MFNPRIMHGEYYKDEDFYLFGYTYIKNEKPKEVETSNTKASENRIESKKENSPKRELYKGFVFK